MCVVPLLSRNYCLQISITLSRTLPKCPLAYQCYMLCWFDRSESWWWRSGHRKCLPMPGKPFPAEKRSTSCFWMRSCVVAHGIAPGFEMGPEKKDYRTSFWFLLFQIFAMAWHCNEGTVYFPCWSWILRKSHVNVMAQNSIFFFNFIDRAILWTNWFQSQSKERTLYFKFAWWYIVVQGEICSIMGNWHNSIDILSWTQINWPTF